MREIRVTRKKVVGLLIEDFIREQRLLVEPMIESLPEWELMLLFNEITEKHGIRCNLTEDPSEANNDLIDDGWIYE